MVRYGMWLGEDINAVGCPTVDGSASCSVYADNAVRIVEDSREKEAAWQFLEGFLAGETEEKPDLTVLPTRRDFLDRTAKELMTLEYVRNEAGEVIVWDSTGEPGLAAKQWLYVLGESIPLCYITREQADEVLQMIEVVDFTPKGGVREVITGILLEELAPYLDWYGRICILWIRNSLFRNTLDGAIIENAQKNIPAEPVQEGADGLIHILLYAVSARNLSQDIPS